ncbi:hypothetical protein [Pseudomonas sp. H3_D04]
MEKLYRFKEFLTSKEASNWLQSLTSTPISAADFAQLWYDGHCDVYLDCCGDAGYLSTPDEIEKITDVIGADMARVDEPWRLSEMGAIGVVGSLRNRGEKEVLWFIDRPPDQRIPKFRPADIQALADKMNGTVPQPSAGAAELENLRLQLEQERSAREAAEAELSRRCADDGKRALNDIRHMLMHDHAEFSAMQTRAEQAEKMVVAMDRQLAEQAEAKRRNDEAFNAMAKQIKDIRTVRPDHQPEANAGGLTFPYATKELEVMCRVAQEHWSGHTPDKRQPKQDAIQRAICKELGLDVPATKTPPNKAIYLAMAIKPDGLPKA